MSGVDDVRDVLTFYSQQDDPIEAFKINQARLQVSMARKTNDAFCLSIHMALFRYWSFIRLLGPSLQWETQGGLFP